MIVVSNTSPIINLACIGRLDILQKLFSEIHIPDSVYEEIVLDGVGKYGAFEVSKSNWIKRKKVNTNLTIALKLQLDKGEAEAIALSIESKSDFLLIDESKGRKIASKFGVKIIGLLGILTLAKRKGLISEIKPIIDDLIEKAGFWINSELYDFILKEVQEN